MKRHSFFAVSLFLLFASCILVSCMDAEKSYREGDYEGVVKALEWKKVLTNDDYILKADSLFALGRAMTNPSRTTCSSFSFQTPPPRNVSMQSVASSN